MNSAQLYEGQKLMADIRSRQEFINALEKLREEKGRICLNLYGAAISLDIEPDAPIYSTIIDELLKENKQIVVKLKEDFEAL